MPTEGALIRATDYTDVRRLVSRILGDRKNDYPTDINRGTFGYGQTVLSESRSIIRTETLVDDLDMASLKSDVLKIATHCGIQNDPLITALPTVTSGDLIDNAHLQAYLAAMPLLEANRFEVAPSHYSDGPFETDITNSRTTPWGNTTVYGQNTVRHSFTVDFGSPERARYFFNTGGQLRFTASRTGGLNSFQDQTWTELLTSMGTIVFNYDTTTANSGTGSNIGFYDLTTTPQQIFTKNAGSIYVYATQYTVNDYTITMSCNVADNRTGEARYLYVNVYFNDDHVSRRAVSDQVTGTLTSRVNIRRATAPYTGEVEVPIPLATNTLLLST